MKNKKTIYSILSILFVLIFSFFNFSEYKDFHAKKIETKIKEKEINSKLKNFSLEKISEIQDIDFFYTPNKELLNQIVENINNAKNDIFLEVYLLTEKRIQEALIKAHGRWVTVKIILEKDPYLAYSINDKAFEKLKKVWIDIVRSRKDHYAFNHSKVFIIDSLVIISTWNYSYSTFTKNRDLFIFTYDKNIYSKLIENFNNDFNWKKINIYDDNLIFSPISSRTKFEKLFEWANKSIDMYFQYFKDDNLVNKVIKLKKESGLKIRVIIPETAVDDENTTKLKNAGVDIYIMSKNKMHSKAILIDNKYLFIWSINFSENSIDSNREVGILINNKKIIDDFLDVFNQDIKNTILQ